MIQCPYCAHRVLDAGISISATVRLTGLPDGDYREVEIDSYGRDWHTLQCCRCGKSTDEDTARKAFEVETLYDETTDDVYDYYEAVSLACPDTNHPYNESAYSIAGAWNVWLWQQDQLATEHTVARFLAGPPSQED